MEEQFDVEHRWPELFTGLNHSQRHAIIQALASAWHEGWIPNREDVANLTDKVRGSIDQKEYSRRVAVAARKQVQPVY